MFISNIRFLTEASPSVGPSLSSLDSSSIDSAQYAAQHRPRSPGHQRCAVWRCGGVGGEIGVTRALVTCLPCTWPSPA